MLSWPCLKTIQDLVTRFALKIYFQKTFNIQKNYQSSCSRFRAKYLLAKIFESRKKQEETQTLRDDIIRESPWTYYGALTLQNHQRSLQSRLEHAPPDLKNTD